jgi:hypothetical protein
MGTGQKLKKQQEEEKKNFKPYEGRNKRERHIRLTKDMMTCERYLALSHTAKVLYQYMKLWAYGSKEFKDKETFDYSVSLATKMLNCSNKTAIKAFKELEVSGFIERQNNSAYSKETSKWSFSDKWYSTNIEYKQQ